MDTEPIELLKALAVETRVKIINLLKTRGPLGAKEMARHLGITTAAVSQHLKILRHAGLVRRERKGYWIPYALNPEALEKCGQQVIDLCSCGCEGTGAWREKALKDASLEDLKKYKEELERELASVRKRLEEKEG